MPTPLKAKKTPRNQPVKFDETLSAVLPSATIPAAAPRFTTDQMRIGLVIIWILAAATAGIGLGRLILSSRSTTAPVAAFPVATAGVNIAGAPAFTLKPAQPVPSPSLKVAGKGSSPDQAQVGQPFATAAGIVYQPAAGPSSLQPGFTPFGHTQGNAGTTPVN